MDNTLIKTNEKSQTINEILKSILLDDFGIIDYKDCVIANTNKDIRIEIIDVEDMRFFIVNMKQQKFTMTEYLLFNNNPNELFDLYIPKNKYDEIIPNIDLNEENLTYVKENAGKNNKADN